MEPNKILSADVLDIVFEGRNKEYGAYELRRTYNRRLTKAILITSSVLLVSIAGCSVMARSQGEKAKLIDLGDVDISAVKERVDPPPPPPPPPPKPIEQKFEIKAFTPPKIVKDQDVRKEDVPPVQEDLDQVKIGTVNQDGMKDDRLVGPPAPVGDGKGVVEAPKKEDDAPFMKVEKESEFPGGSAAWLRFLNKNLKVPDDAINNGISGRVVVRFIVDKEGNVSDVEAVSGPEEGGLRQAAVKVIKMSGKWIPAIQNGRMVKSYKQQPIIFEVGEQ
ncbi:energy transducer TonB [Puia sp.]|jgi:protein TonB|uniref:energy transducer TonB n=1 Tax=Puia sp. TaxID=2045100 RepID=UPI002F424265